MEVYRMRLRSFGVGLLHMCARTDEEGGGGIATIGHCTYAPRIFEGERVGVRGQWSNGEDVSEGGWRHGERVWQEQQAQRFENRRKTCHRMVEE